MRAEWQIHSVAALIEHGALIIGDGYRAKNDELARSGLPFARAGNINDGFRFDAADCFPETNIERVGDKVSEPGDVVFTSKGTVGRFAFVRPCTPRFVYSPQLCFWRSRDPGLIDARFLFYWMFGPEFFVQFKGVAGQTDMAEYVNLRDQRRMHITLPPLSVQHAIAEILGALDDRIELSRRMNGTLEAIARAIFKSWCVDFTPVCAKAEGRQPAGMDAETAALFPDSFEESESGKIPRGWRPAPLDEVADFRNGLAMQRFPATDGGSLPVVKIAELNRGDTVGADRANADLNPLYVVDDGDVLFSWSGSLTVRIWCGGRGALNQHLFKVTSASFPRWFYYCWLLEHLPDFQLIAAGKATTMGHIQRHHLHDATVVVPPRPLLDRTSQFLEPLLGRFVANNVESRTLAALRDALLPKLLSGEVRVPQASRSER